MRKKKKTDSQRRSEAFARWQAERKAPAPPADPVVDTAENEPDDVDREWPDEPGDEQCKDIFQEVAQAPLRKPLGKCVTEIAHDGVHWRL